MSHNTIPKKIPEGIMGILENSIASLMVQGKVPGMSLAVVAGDDIIYAKGFGARNLKQNLPATPDTLYGIGSCTKSYTALGIMQLAQEEKLDVNDPVSKYLNFKLGKRKNPISIHHLLTHSTGIPNLGMAEVLLGRTAGIKEYYIPMSSLEDILTFINGASQEIAAEPGVRFAYWNEGYTLLGAIIEKVSKMKYEEYIKEKILNPLKMNRSTFLKEDFEKDSDIMTAHYVQMKDWKISSITAAPHPFDKFIYAPGGMLSSTIEQINYLKAFINGGEFEGTRILNADLIEEMLKIHIETEMVRSIMGGFEKEGYGYGWVIIEDFFGHKLVAHTGGTGVSSAFLGFIPDKKIGVASANNSGAADPASLPILILAFLLGKDPMKDLKMLEIEQQLASLTGVYETYKGINRISVVKKGPMLYLVGEDAPFSFNQGTSTPIIPESIEDLKFYYLSGVGGKTSATFTKDSPNKISLYIDRNRFNKVRDLPT